MYKKISLFFLLFFVSGSLFAGYKRIRITYRGNYPYVKLYLNGSYKGQLFRNATRTWTKRAGQRYVIKARYKGRSSIKSFFHTRHRSVVFVRPTRSGVDVPDVRHRRHLRVWYRGTYPYIRLYVNGRFKARISRGMSRLFYMAAGKTYRLAARYRHKRARKTVFLSRRGNKTVTFYRPSR